MQFLYFYVSMFLFTFIHLSYTKYIVKPSEKKVLHNDVYIHSYSIMCACVVSLIALKVISSRTDTDVPVPRYKNDSEMKQVTHFVCFRPCAMCGIYTKFEKSVVVVSTTRYEEGRITPTRWRQWNLQLYHFQVGLWER